MTSIFIWKADAPNDSKQFIKIYSGANWVLEDNEYSSKSYIYLEQIVIPESGDSVITFNIKNMPKDWVGSELLEVKSIPYKYIKSDNYGVLEQIGDWVRFTSNIQIEYTAQNVLKELQTIKKWASLATKVDPSTTDSSTVELNYNTIQNGLYEFMNKYNVPNSIPNTHGHNNYINDKCVVQYNKYKNTHKMHKKMQNNM